MKRDFDKRKPLTRSEAYIGEIVRVARKSIPETQGLGRLVIQKLAYFSQMRGLPIELRFQRHQYGPYSHPLPHILDRLEGLYIRDESRTIERSNLRILDEEEWLTATLPTAISSSRAR